MRISESVPRPVQAGADGAPPNPAMQYARCYRLIFISFQSYILELQLYHCLQLKTGSFQ